MAKVESIRLTARRSLVGNGEAIVSADPCTLRRRREGLAAWGISHQVDVSRRHLLGGQVGIHRHLATETDHARRGRALANLVHDNVDGLLIEKACERGHDS